MDCQNDNSGTVRNTIQKLSCYTENGCPNSPGSLCDPCPPEGGERPDRRQWRRKGGERVAAVGRRQVRFAGRRLRRAPQQETGGFRHPFRARYFDRLFFQSNGTPQPHCVRQLPFQGSIMAPLKGGQGRQKRPGGFVILFRGVPCHNAGTAPQRRANPSASLRSAAPLSGEPTPQSRLCRASSPCRGAMTHRPPLSS